MTELSFLIKLILDDELPPKHKQMCADRISELEEKMSQPYIARADAQARGMQAPSTQKILDEMAMNPTQAEGPVPISPAAAQALQARQQLIQQAVSGKTEPGRDRPRKF